MERRSNQPHQESGKENKNGPKSPDVWELLDRREKLEEQKPKSISIYSDGTVYPRLSVRLKKEQIKLTRLGNKIQEEGTPRDKLILELGSFHRIKTRGLTREEEFQKFRSETEQMTDEQIAQVIKRRKQGMGATFGSISILTFMKQDESGKLTVETPTKEPDGANDLLDDFIFRPPLPTRSLRPPDSSPPSPGEPDDKSTPKPPKRRR